MSGTAQGALSIFRAWLAAGIHEVPAGSNRTPIGVEFGWNGVAWCAEAASLALSKSGTAGYHTASVYLLQSQFRREGRWGHTPRVGALAIYSSADFPNGGAHVNMVEAVNGASMTCIGGNEGDAVRRSVRSVSSVYGFGYPPYANSPAPAPAPTPEGFLMGLSQDQQNALVNRVDNLEKHLLHADQGNKIVENLIGKVVEEKLTAFGLRLAALLDAEGVIDLDDDGQVG